MAKRRGQISRGVASGRVNINAIANSAVQKGIKAIVNDHPIFRRCQAYIASHVDEEALRVKINTAYRVMEEIGVPTNERADYLAREIADSVASGDLLDDSAKGIILTKGLEAKAKKGWWRSRFGEGKRVREQLDGLKYLDKTIDAFAEVYDLLASGKYHGPGAVALAEDAAAIGDAGAIYITNSILYRKGVLEGKKYDAWQRAIVQGVKEREKSAMERREKLVTSIVPQQAAAVIMAVIGIIFIAFFGLSINGNVIGNSTTPLQDIFGIGVGVVFIILSFMSFTRLRKARKLLKFNRKRKRR